MVMRSYSQCVSTETMGGVEIEGGVTYIVAGPQQCLGAGGAQRGGHGVGGVVGRAQHAGQGGGPLHVPLRVGARGHAVPAQQHRALYQACPGSPLFMTTATLEYFYEKKKC